MQTTVASSKTSPVRGMGPIPQRATRARVLGFKAAAAGLPGGPVVKDLPAGAGDRSAWPAGGLPASQDGVEPEAGSRLWFLLDPQCPALSGDAALLTGPFQGG